VAREYLGYKLLAGAGRVRMETLALKPENQLSLHVMFRKIQKIRTIL
jgi:hypothetical protein